MEGTESCYELSRCDWHFNCSGLPRMEGTERLKWHEGSRSSARNCSGLPRMEGTQKLRPVLSMTRGCTIAVACPQRRGMKGRIGLHQHFYRAALQWLAPN